MALADAKRCRVNPETGLSRWTWLLAAKRGLVAVLALGLGAGAARAEAGWSLFNAPVLSFPPGVPVYGEKIAEVAAGDRGIPMLRPPAELAHFVNERFFPALSSRMMMETMSSRLSERVDAYRAARGTLINELADQLTALNGLDEEVRGRELRAFAERQSPRILALERDGEELRRDLIDGGVLQRSVDWSKKRSWTLGVTRFRNEYMERDAHFQVVRAAAFYQDGLTTEQRGLLLEVAAEAQQRARAARVVAGPKAGDPSAMYFSPALARLRLPKKMPPELVAKIGRYNQQKTTLKRELYDLVVARDRESRAERNAAFEALADRQWPQLVELEKLAEEIRTALAALPRERLAAPPLLPEGLMQRIQEYQRDRQRFLDEFQQTMNAADSMARWNPEERNTIRAKVAESFHERTRERFQEMRARYDVIQADLKLVAAGQFDPETGRPLTPETLLQNYTVANEKFDTFGREEVIYRGYRTAMLMPGLSAEQRRLLFGAALIELAQPLPLVEMAPSGPVPQPRS